MRQWLPRRPNCPAHSCTSSESGGGKAVEVLPPPAAMRSLIRSPCAHWCAIAACRQRTAADRFDRRPHLLCVLAFSELEVPRPRQIGIFSDCILIVVGSGEALT